jgi:hypothetical protein
MAQTFTLYIDYDCEDIAAKTGVAEDCSEEFDPENLTVTRRCNDGYEGLYVNKYENIEQLRRHYHALLLQGWVKKN